MAEKLGLKAAFHLLPQWFHSSGNRARALLPPPSSAESRKKASIPEFQAVGARQTVFTTWVWVLCSVGPLEKYDCICFAVIPQLIEWFCWYNYSRDPQLPQCFSISCCFFTNSPMIDQYFVSLSCWEQRKRTST